MLDDEEFLLFGFRVARVPQGVGLDAVRFCVGLCCCFVLEAFRPLLSVPSFADGHVAFCFAEDASSHAVWSFGEIYKYYGKA